MIQNFALLCSYFDVYCNLITYMSILFVWNAKEKQQAWTDVQLFFSGNFRNRDTFGLLSEGNHSFKDAYQRN